MVTLIEHIKRLKKWTTDNEDVILQSILLNKFIIDDDSLFCYYIETTPWEKSITLTWVDGNGDKIKKWIEQVMKENGCTKMYGITMRWKSFIRKFGGKPVGMLVEREAF